MSSFADVTSSTASPIVIGNPPAPIAGGGSGSTGGAPAGGSGTTSSGAGVHYKSTCSVHGNPPNGVVKGDVYMAQDAGSISNGTGWNTGGLTIAVQQGDFLVYLDPEWHVLAHR